MSTPYVINDLPNGTYSVTWPGYEYVLVNNPGKALRLLEILFEVVGVDEAIIGVQEQGRDVTSYMYISNILWLEDRGRELMAKRLSNYVVPGVRFTDIYQAEKFKDHMEQRLIWRQLGGKWNDNADH